MKGVPATCPNTPTSRLLAAIQAADPSGSPSLRTGIPTYLALAPEEQAIVNRGLRRLIERLPKTGPVMALEIYSAVGLKCARIEAADGQ